MHVPPNAKRVFTGIIFDVYHWEQALFDGHTSTHEALLRKQDGVTIIAVSGNHILYAEEEQASVNHPFITLFGGKREEGEIPLDTAKRELLEESGYVSDDWEFWKKEEALSTKIEWTVYTFIARNAKKISGQSLDGGEKIKIREATFEEFLRVAARPNFRNKDVSFDLLRWRAYEPKKLEKLKKKLFG